MASRLIEAISESSQGSFHPDREKDELTKALQNPEHPGRTRGDGMVPWKIGFSEHSAAYRSQKRNKAEKDELICEMERRLLEYQAINDLVIQQRVERQVEIALSQLRTQPPSNPDVIISPTGKKSSCASNPDEELCPYPVEKITQREPREVHVPIFNLSHKVAYDMAIPTTKGDRFHGDEIPLGYSRVTVDDVIDKYEELDLEIPGGDGVTKLGQATHGIILWWKRYIVLAHNRQPSPFRETSLERRQREAEVPHHKHLHPKLLLHQSIHANCPRLQLQV